MCSYKNQEPVVAVVAVALATTGTAIGGYMVTFPLVSSAKPQMVVGGFPSVTGIEFVGISLEFASAR